MSLVRTEQPPETGPLLNGTSEMHLPRNSAEARPAPLGDPELDLESTSPSLSPSSLSTVESYAARRHRHPPPSSPAFRQMCEKYLETNNVEALAELARTRGIPPQLRGQAWPLLLATHPFVQKPHIAVEFPTDTTVTDTKVPRKQIERDLQRMARRLEHKHERRSTSTGSTPSPVTDFDSSAEREFRQSVYASISSAVCSFLDKWGDRLSYEPAMLWLGHELSESLGGFPLDEKVFENAVLVFCHAPESDPSDTKLTEPRGPRDGILTQSVSLFIAGMRGALPALSGHFDQEYMFNMLESEDWLLWWIKWYGTKVFVRADAERLWDVYFGWRSSGTSKTNTDAVDAARCTTPQLVPRVHHLFCCLAILKANQFKLLELDQSEARQMLARLPPMNMEAVLAEAQEMWKGYVERHGTLETPDLVSLVPLSDRHSPTSATLLGIPRGDPHANPVPETAGES